MHANKLNKVIASQDLKPLLANPNLLVVDLSEQKNYLHQHIKTARHFQKSALIQNTKPPIGLLPDKEQLLQSLAALGLEKQQHIVAYDEGGTTAACRFLWTLDVIGYRNNSLLDGGLTGWLQAGGEIDNKQPEYGTSSIAIAFDRDYWADKQYVLENLNNPDVVLWDTRSPGEYVGTEIRAARGGHIPGARHLNWLDTIDRYRGGRLKTAEELHALLRQAEIALDKEIIVYCQTHQRSSHSYIMLKSLGYRRVKGYAGAWAEWGNDPDTPIER